MSNPDGPVPLTITTLPEKAQAKFCDTLAIDNKSQTLFLGDNWSGGVDMFDISSAEPRFVKTVKLRGRIYGIVAVEGAQKIFVGLSGSVLAAIDLSGGDAAVTLVQTGGVGHVDLLDYDAAQRRVYAANRMDGILTWVDAETNEVEGRVDGLGHGLEQPRLNPHDGLVYLTDNRENVLYQIDPASAVLRQTFAIGVECFPNGMAINSKNQAILASSNEDQPCTVVWDLNRQTVASVSKESGCGDGAVYVPSIDRFLVANSGFPGGPVVGIFGDDPVRFLGNVPSGPGASWVDIDLTHGLIYAPTVSEGRPGLLSFAASSI